MSNKLTYLLIDGGAILFPLIFSVHSKINFYKEWKAFWLANLVTSFIFILWDIYFTQIGIWGFNEDYITGLKIFNLPVEEVLFFICIPYSSVFTYYCLKLFCPDLRKNFSSTISVVLIFILLLISIFNFQKLYTLVTCISLASLICCITFVFKNKWLNVFYLMYLIILLPFFIVNGILTGTGLDAPIVWYNNSENMSLRILTIPVEDVFYGMLLLLLNVLLFERFKKEPPTNNLEGSV
ncbi:MAG: lycopene cyclase domain-containing protein [Bacteroidota bacterium]